MKLMRKLDYFSANLHTLKRYKYTLKRLKQVILALFETPISSLVLTVISGYLSPEEGMDVTEIH